MASDVRVVFVTVPNEEVALTISKQLVEERLVACVNIVPGLRSVYRWQGQIEDEQEHLLICKTSEERLDAMIPRVAEIHPYTVPEVIALSVAEGHSPYLDWVLAQTSVLSE